MVKTKNRVKALTKNGSYFLIKNSYIDVAAHKTQKSKVFIIFAMDVSPIVLDMSLVEKYAELDESGKCIKGKDFEYEPETDEHGSSG